MAYISKRDGPTGTKTWESENGTRMAAARPGGDEDQEEDEDLEDEEEDDDLNAEDPEEADDDIFRKNLETEFPLSGGETDDDV